MYRPHCVRSVLTTSVKILPYRPPAWLIRANCRHLKNSGGCKGSQSHDLCDAGAILYEVNYEATQLGAGQYYLLGSCVAVKGLMNEKDVYLKCGLYM